jgi:hypothetical protein
MHHDRIQEITIEMCDLLNEQTEWLKSSTGRLTAQSGEAVDEYVHRNDRLRQLGAELSELDWREERLSAKASPSHFGGKDSQVAAGHRRGRRFPVSQAAW